MLMNFKITFFNGTVNLIGYEACSCIINGWTCRKQQAKLIGLIIGVPLTAVNHFAFSPTTNLCRCVQSIK